MIVGKKLDHIYTKVFNTNRASKTGPFLDKKLIVPAKKVGGKHENFLINKAVAIREKQAEKAALIETKEIENCTFTPIINKNGKKSARSQSQVISRELRTSKSQDLVR
jgi:hypothetical protein